MKLHEILDDDNAIEKWIKEWTVSTYKPSDYVVDGKMNPKWAKVYLWPNEKDQIFDPPMPRSWWDHSLTEVSITKTSEHKDATAVIHDFQKMPDANELVFSGAKIASFKGIETMTNLNGLDIYQCTLDCGLLRLLKCASLKKLVATRPQYSSGDGGYRNVSDNKEFTKALNIVEKHLKGHRDVLECQEELIDAGLDEYAKL